MYMWCLLSNSILSSSAGLGEFKIRDLNDEINKLLREKGHWEHRIKELGGPDYRVRIWVLHYMLLVHFISNHVTFNACGCCIESNKLLICHCVFYQNELVQAHTSVFIASTVRSKNLREDSSVLHFSVISVHLRNEHENVSVSGFVFSS